ncbi:GumC family protein [Sphingobacterium ginsenosidimutans]|uniref:non-specific protein-tyrosine kinase n=1 Tax=Sphingobacterium ginsenosidimutans TaxID=687845 RepID=A0ABP7ZVM8_9SPHI
MKATEYTTIQKDRSINILDVLKHLLYHWKWFALSILIFGAYYYYQYAKSPFIFRSAETIIIKTPMNTPRTARISRTNEAYNSISVASEILQLKSKELMRQTVKRIGAEMSYSIVEGLRQKELYKNSPVLITLPQVKEEASFSFTVTLLGNNQVLLSNWSVGNKALEVKTALGKTVKTPIGQLVVQGNKDITDSYLDQEIKVSKYALEDMVDYFVSTLSITQMEEDASLLQLVCEDTNPRRATDLIGEMVVVYNEIALQDKNQIGINTANFIRERLSIIEQELGAVESNIQDLRIQNQGMDAATVGQAYFADTRTYQAERTKVETDMNLAQMMRNYLADKAKRTDLIPNNTGLVDASVEAQISDYNATLLRRNRLIEGSSEANPVVQDLDKGLNAIRNNIARAVDNAIGGLHIKANNMKREEYQARGKALQVPQKQRVMLSVERQQKVKEELYLYLLNKREENAINQAMTEDNIRIIDPATASFQPIGPSKIRKLGLGIGIGFILPAIIILTLSILDTGVRRRQDVEDAITVPLLGEIPFIRTRRSAQDSILVSSVGRDPLTEAFRILRTNISFMSREGKHPKVITFTSFIPGVGKTFTSLNLSNTLSFLDKKVVVIDLDLRKGTLSKRIGIKEGKGVSHYLSDINLSIEEIIHRNLRGGNVDYISIGTEAPNPVELLLSKRLDQMIAELSNQYDYIIIDGVPMGIVADATVVDRISDLTLFVVRAGKMDKRQLPEIQKIYEEKRLSNLAVILNGIEMGQSRYGYGYGYGYGYNADEGRGFGKRFARKIRNLFR